MLQRSSRGIMPRLVERLGRHNPAHARGEGRMGLLAAPDRETEGRGGSRIDLEAWRRGVAASVSVRITPAPVHDRPGEHKGAPDIWPRLARN
jgi:hypothetical protein